MKTEKKIKSVVVMDEIEDLLSELGASGFDLMNSILTDDPVLGNVAQEIYGHKEESEVRGRLQDMVIDDDKRVADDRRKENLWPNNVLIPDGERFQELELVENDVIMNKPAPSPSESINSSELSISHK